MSLPKRELQGYFMRNPLLYRIGIDGTSFSTWLFVKWLMYALIHAAFIFYSCFYVLQHKATHQSDGKDIGFWVGGMLVYGICIFVANMVLAFKHFTHYWIGTFFFLLCICAYFVFFWLFSITFKNEVDHLFKPTFSMRIVYLIIFFIVFAVYLAELAYSACRKLANGDHKDMDGETEELLDNRQH